MASHTQRAYVYVPGQELPSTGGSGSTVYVMSGFGIILFAAAAYEIIKHTSHSMA